jgi:hypothetical protein
MGFIDICMAWRIAIVHGQWITPSTEALQQLAGTILPYARCPDPQSLLYACPIAKLT